MERKTYYEDDNLRLEYIEEGNYIHETWWGLTTPEMFANLLEEIVQLLRKTRSTGLLLDARQHKGLGPESQNLAARRIGEYAQTVGKFKEAIIVPQDVFSQFSVKNYSEKLKEKEYPVDSRFFYKMDEAEAWLQE